ncbi:GPR98 protein, partial [Polyodon spathula]|nr:GPR98 protein [Polyodon spathula]
MPLQRLPNPFRWCYWRTRCREMQCCSASALLRSPLKPNDKPDGVLSISSALLAQTLIIDEDLTSSIATVFKMNAAKMKSDSNSHILQLDGPFVNQKLIKVTHLLFSVHLVAHTECLTNDGSSPFYAAQMVFYIQDVDDVYGLVRFHPSDEQKIESHPSGRFLSLSFLRQGGTMGDVRLNYTALYIPTGPIDPGRAKDGVLNTTRKNSIIFPAEQSWVQKMLPIRNDAFLQNGAHFVVQLDSVELVSITPPIPPVSPRLWGVLNISLIITPDIANGEIGFTSN